MRRNTLNYIVDTVALILMLAMIGTGLVMRYLLPPGSGGRGGGEGRSLWSLGRHDWGGLHYWLAIGLIALLLLHVALHWGWVYATTRRLARSNGTGEPIGAAQRWVSGTIVTLILTAGVGVFLWIGAGDVESHRGAGGRGGRAAMGGLGPHEALEAPPGQSDAEASMPTDAEAHEDMGIRGSMTLAEAASTLGIPPEQLRGALGLPATVSLEERLGRLRREYGFEMSDVRNAARPRPRE